MRGREHKSWFGELDGLVVKGNESGGFVGEESSFILFQHWCKSSSIPIYIQGGTSLQVCAALAALGAKGAVFDSQILLMPEAGLSRPAQDLLRSLSGTETVTVGDPGKGKYLRLLQHPRAKAALDFIDTYSLSQIEQVRDALGQVAVGFEDPSTELFLLGHDVALAADYADRFGSIASLFKAVRKAVATQADVAANQLPLARDNSFARSFGVDVPLIQGPMTRVSDNAEFAVKVAKGGALPTLAIAMMRPDQIQELMRQTKSMIGKAKWGAGFLGFLPQAMFDAQMEAVLANSPDFAIVAGGRPDQAVKFENAGVPCFLHLPSAKLLPYYLENGARRFIFEGRECGGHVGPLSSFVLWSTMVDALCAQIDAGVVRGQDLDCVFAGGLHDAFSSAFLQVLVAPLADRGAKIAMIVGTAYVLTEEIVNSGAVLPKFQDVVREHSDTAVLASGPGHASRSMLTPFVETFVGKQNELKQDESVSSEDTREILDEMIMGTLRVASKGTRRSVETSEIEQTEAEEQFQIGMYMIGQVASLRGDVQSIESLHKSLTDDAVDILQQNRPDPAPHQAEASQPLDVAIVGISAAVPGAMHKDAFWRNILDKVDSVDEVPKHRWDWRLYFDEDRNARDKIYSRWGGFLEDMPFEPGKYGITPKSLLSVDPMQLMALKLADQALEDAGYADMDRDTREHTSVMIGASGGSGDVGLQYNLRAETPRFSGQLAPHLSDQLPEWSEDTFAGILINVVSGRITNRLDLGGANYTTDAACASSLAAVYQAANELRSGRSRMAIAGGVDTQQSPFGFMCFSQTQALSPRGRCRSFDKGADGIAISEGIVMLVLKRLEDAEADGDRVYAVLKGVGSSSDGKGKALSAPEAKGQLRAMRRAYDQAGYTPADVQLFEAHGTGTVVGDSTELNSTGMLVQAGNTAPRRAVIGSVKTNIGHTKASAGIAGLAKVAMALHHKVLPPHRGVEDPNDVLANDEAPLYLLDDAEPWLAPDGVVRRGSVSAFGFGGTNFHATLEEYTGEYRPQYLINPTQDWPSEILLLSAGDRRGLCEKIEKIQSLLAAGSCLKPRYLSAAYVKTFKSDDAVRAGFVFDNLDQARKKLNALLAHLNTDAKLADGVFLSEAGTPGKVAVLFSGQGSQYTFMHREAAVYLPEMEAALSRADSLLQGSLTRRYGTQKVLSEFLYPRGAYTDKARQDAQKALTSTDIAQPALGAVEAGLWRFLSKRLGLQGDVFAGHSYGEFVAHHAAGVLSFDDLMAVSEARGRLIVEKAADSGQELGSMLALSASRADADALAAEVPDLVVANDNSPTQVILSGPDAAVATALSLAETKNLRATRLPVAAAFHSDLMRPAQKALGEVIDGLAWNAHAAGAVYSNAKAAPHGSDVCAAMTDHLVAPVNFVDQIGNMYEAGARIFVEVGPKAVLSKLVRQILKDRPHVSLTTDEADGRMSHLLTAIAGLAVEAVPMDLERLFDHRGCQDITSRDLDGLGQPAKPSKSGWWINGSGVRRAKDPQKTVGLTAEAALSVPDAAGGIRQPETAQVQSENFTGQMVLAQETASRQKPPHVPAYSQNSSFKQRKGKPVYDSPIQSDSDTTEASVSLGFFQMVARVVESAEAVALSELRAGEPVSQPRASHKRVRVRPAPEALSVTEVAPKLPAATTPMAQKPEPSTTPEPLAVSAPAQAPAMAMAETAAVTSTPVAEATPPAPAKVDLKMALLNVVSDKTGYDEDMLEMDQNIEADLGIDSIKRVDIVAGLVKALPDPVAEKLGDSQRSALNQAKTLDDMLAILTDAETASNFNLAGAGHASTQQDTPTVDPSDDLPRPDQARFVVAARREPLPDDVRSALTEGAFVLVPSGTDLDQAMAEALTAAGHEVHHVEATAMADETTLSNWVKAQAFEPLAGIIHLAALGQAPLELAADPDVWRQQLFASEKSLYVLLRDLDFVPQAHAVAVTALGGTFARDGGGLEMKLQGGSTGVLKSLLREDEGRRCKAVDLDPEQPLSAKVDQIMTETAIQGGRVEVGYPKRERTVFRTELAPIKTGSPEKIGDLKVILATGGARGITAETIRELGAPGVTFVLTGRSALPTAKAGLRDDPKLAELTEVELAKHFVKNDKLSIPEGRRKASRVVAAREMLDCIDALKTTGARVEYMAMNVNSPDAVRVGLEEIYKTHGRIDGVVHGAGVIEDKLLRDIPSDSWDRVVETKVIGLLLLMRNLRSDGLKFFYAFTSVAGRFGNAGQTSYATANELMARIACQWQADLGPDTQVKAMNWGPWAPTTFGAGMVTPETEAKFRAQGVYLVQAQLGADLFRQENRCAGTLRNVEVVFGTAPWEAAEASRSSLHREGPAGLLGQAEPEMGPGGKQKLRIRIDAHHPYLQDHIVDGNPVLPMAVAMEVMASAVARVFGGALEVAAIEDARLYNGVIVAEHSRALVAVLSPQSHGMEEQESVSVKLFTEGDEKRPHYGARFILTAKLPAAPTVDRLGDPAGARQISQAEAYADHLFHGPSFQAVLAAPAVWEKGAVIDTRASFPGELLGDGECKGDRNAWLFDPFLVDGIAQLPLLWGHALKGIFALPLSFGRIERFTSDLSEADRIEFQVVDATPDVITADAILRDHRGTVLMRVSNMQHGIRQAGQLASSPNAETKDPSKGRAA
ncbi:type I polyketide synthase [Tritonibacter multivorans]|uniref:type I polyketide synthase n=1 Tax=Tritonibacter multivorans TaxID=928856 RepID=UPI0013F4BF4E|nr:type I polyketide synthase [Tritonibacter multivorans]